MRKQYSHSYVHDSSIIWSVGQCPKKKIETTSNVAFKSLCQKKKSITFLLLLYHPLYSLNYMIIQWACWMSLCARTKEKSLRLRYQSRISKLVQLTPELESHIFVCFGGMGKYDILKGYNNELRFMCIILIEISPEN